MQSNPFKEPSMNMLLPDKFVPTTGAKVRVVVYDLMPLREDYGVTPVLLSVLRDLARGTEVIVEHSDDVLSEVSLTEKRIEDALGRSDADLLVFGSYVATRSNVQPMIHMVCTYGRAMEPSSGLPEGVDLEQAIRVGDAIVQLPRHVLFREVLPLMAVETLDFQNGLAEEIFYIARFIQAVKLYKAGQFEETVQLIDSLLTRIGSSEGWPDYWVPFNYLYMLGGLAYLRLGNGQAALYTLSNAIARSTAAKMRVQRVAEQIMASLMQPAAGDPPAAEEPPALEEQPAVPKKRRAAEPKKESAPGAEPAA
jgi:hypothetical protein